MIKTYKFFIAVFQIFSHTLNVMYFNGVLPFQIMKIYNINSSYKIHSLYEFIIQEHLRGICMTVGNPIT